MKNDNQNKWGIIFCPKTGQRRPEKLWKKIEKLLEEYQIEYDYLQSENSSSVDRLVKILINNSYKTIIIIGGDSALNDAINSLMTYEHDIRKNIAMGVIPNGLKNDFARFWGFEENNIEQNIKTLIDRRLKTIDIGTLLYENTEGKRCRRYFLNCVTIGLVSSVINIHRQAKVLGGLSLISYLFSSIRMLLHRLEYKMHLHINTDDIKGKLMTICIGNAFGYGFTPNAVPYNGFLDVSIVHHPKPLQLLEGLYLLYSGKILNHKDVLPFRTKKIEIKDSGKAPISVDGRMLKQPKGEINVVVEPNAFNFIIP